MILTTLALLYVLLSLKLTKWGQPAKIFPFWFSLANWEGLSQSQNMGPNLFSVRTATLVAGLANRPLLSTTT